MTYPLSKLYEIVPVRCPNGYVLTFKGSPIGTFRTGRDAHNAALQHERHWMAEAMETN